MPLQPKGYRVTVAFPEATQLAQEADVRISGVPVGSVKKKEPNKETGLTDTEIEIDARYAPIPRDTRAILRQKTLLGETYVELSPGNRSSGRVPDGGRLPEGQVSETVELDEILRTFDPTTRERFSTWLDQAGRGGSSATPRRSTTRSACSPRSPRRPTTSSRCCACRAAPRGASSATRAWCSKP